MYSDKSDVDFLFGVVSQYLQKESFNKIGDYACHSPM